MPDSDYKTIGDYGIKKSTLDIDYNLSTTESNLHDKFYSGVSESNIRYDLVADFSNFKDYRLIKRAMSRNKFYRFSVMKNIYQ